MGDADAGDDAKSEAALEECVRLLSSDSREKKFVGMLLVTRLVPDADDDATLTRVYEATGFARFVTSMLRAAPATPGDGAPATAEEAEARAAQATASHALALATCAALSKSPDVATDDSMVERLPLFAAAMARKGRYAALPRAAVADACEAATRVVAAGGEPIARVAADAGVVAAAAAAVVDAAAAGADGPRAPDADADGALPLLGATRLLAMLLESPAAYDHVHGPVFSVDPRAEGGFEGGDGAGGDAARPTGASFSEPEPEPMKKKKNPNRSEKNRSESKAARAVARAAPSLAYAFASRPGQPEQIEALRCLSLVLSALPARRPQGRLTAELAKAAAGAAPARSGFSSDWLDDVRGGVASVLGAKAPRELKHVALDLCAACVDLAGPAWLCSDALGAGADPLFSGASTRDGDGGKKKTNASFFRLALELTRVETAVLLHDLTRDDADLRANARRMLPVPLVLYERLVGALAADVEAAEEEDTSGGGDSRETTKKALLSAETARAAVTSLADVAGSLVEFLEHLAERVPSGGEGLNATNATNELERDDQDEDEDEDSETDAAVFLAATRALSCFLAELPEPHEARVNRLLPRLFAEHGASALRGLAPSATSRALIIRFMLPYVLQATESPAGLDAFAEADGARAVAFLARRTASRDVQRCVSATAAATTGADAGLRREARGVLAACVAALRNAADGAARGLADERCGEAAGAAFASLADDLARWGKAAAEELARGEPDLEDLEDADGVAFTRRVAEWFAGDVLLFKNSWRDAARVMAGLVPEGAALGEGAAVGGGGFLLVPREEDSGFGNGGFDDPIEL
jgi:hypothetical protein